MKTRITELFGIRLPIIAGGMAWCSGWRLASAVSNAGGLGLLGAGSMHLETLDYHIQQMKASTQLPWGVNLPLMYPQTDELVALLIRHEVPIVFTSAGSPKKFTQRFHDAGMKVAHVVSSSRFAVKCEEAGVDAVVARMNLKFKTPLVPDDTFISRLAIKKDGIKYVFYQDIFREKDEKLCFSGVIEIVCLVNGRLANSDDYDRALEKYIGQ